jgi:hypothetical protein
MGQVWRDTRERAAKKLAKPELLKVQLKSLRNYSGAQLYEKIGRTDIFEVMRHLRHKKLDTTRHYLSGIPRMTEREYITKVIKLGEPDTIQQIESALNDGFEYKDTAEGYKFYRKLKL